MQAEADRAERETVLLATRALVGIAARSLASISDDVSLAQYRVLVLIEGRGPQTVGELAQSLDVNPSTVTRVCDRLADKKLIRRHAPANDRRTIRVELSAHGRRLVEQVMNRRRSYIDQTLNRMAVESRKRLVESLTEFAAAAGELSDQAWTLGWPINRDLENQRCDP